MHHDHKTYSRKAAELFERLLDTYGWDPTLVWLLNFSYMTTGEFPDNVPTRYLIPDTTPFYSHFLGDDKERLTKKYHDLHLVESSQEYGLDGPLDAGRGTAVADFDQDGYLDLVWGGAFQSMQMRCFNGETFVDRTDEWNLSHISGTHIITAADYNGDSWMDLFISRPLGTRKGDFLLLRNEEGQTFRDVTQEVNLFPSGDEHPQLFVWSSVWGDIDGDGDLDLLVTTFGLYNPEGDNRSASPLEAIRDNFPLRLYRNDMDSNGNVTFTDVTDAYGLGKGSLLDRQNVWGAAFGDYDRDGDLDLVFGLWHVPGIILYENKDRRFTRTNLLSSDAIHFQTALVDINHDGLLDVYGAGAGFSPGGILQGMFGQGKDRYHTGSKIWVQTPAGTFQRHDEYFSGGMPFVAMGANFGDLNNDGAIDWYQGTGNPEGWMVIPNLLYMGKMQDGQPVLETDNISGLFGVGTIQKGHGIVFFDFDDDGDQDIYSNLGGMWSGDPWPNQFFKNESKLTNSWIKIRLQGSKENRNVYGLGAMIKVIAENGQGQTRERTYHMDNGTGFGSQSYLAHIGLFDAQKIIRVEVTWLGDTTPKTYPAHINTLNILKQDEGT